MVGATAEDIIGSVYEFDNLPRRNFPLFQLHSFFTDDSILTLAVAKVILEGGDYGEENLAFGNAYPDASYGGVPAEIAEEAKFRLTPILLEIAERFSIKYMVGNYTIRAPKTIC